MTTYNEIANFICKKLREKGEYTVFHFYIAEQMLYLFLQKYFGFTELNPKDIDFMIIKLNNKKNAVKININGIELTFTNTDKSIIGLDKDENEVIRIKTSEREQDACDVFGEVKVDDTEYNLSVKNEKHSMADAYEYKRIVNGETTMHGEYAAFGVKKSNEELFDFIVRDNKTGKRIKDRTSFLFKLVDKLNGTVYPDDLVAIRFGYEKEQTDNVDVIFNDLEKNLSVYYKSKAKEKGKELK